MNGWRQGASNRERVHWRPSTERIDRPAVEVLPNARGGDITVADHQLTAVWKAQRPILRKALRFVASKAGDWLLIIVAMITVAACVIALAS